MIWMLTTIATPLLGMIVVAVSVAVAVLGLVVVRRTVPIYKLEENNEVAGFIYAVVGVIYAVLLALVVLAVWESFSESAQIVDNEANSISELYYDAEALPEPLRQQVTGKLGEYVQTILAEEWPLLATGKSSPRVDQIRRDLFRLYLAWLPASAGEAAWHSESLKRLNNASGYRDTRVYHSGESLPTVMWSVLVLGGMVTVGYSYLYGVKSFTAHALMTGSLAALISCCLFLIVAMDYPFAGGVMVSQEPLQLVLEEIGGARPD